MLLLYGCNPTPGDALPGTLERDRIEALAVRPIEPIARKGCRSGRVIEIGGYVLLVQDPASPMLPARCAAISAAEARPDELTGVQLADDHPRRIRGRCARRRHAAFARERQRLKDLLARRSLSAGRFRHQQSCAGNYATDAAWRAAEAQLLELQRGTRVEQLRQARQAVEQGRAALKELQLTSGRLEVRAPVNAYVDALPWRPGERPPRGSTVAVLLETGAPHARIHVPASMRLSTRVGMRAVVRVDGIDTPFTGRVRYLAIDAEFTPYYSLTEADRSRLSYLAEVELDGAAAAELPAGVPVEVDLQPATPP